MRYYRKDLASVLRASAWVITIGALFATGALAGDDEKPAVSGRNSKIQLSGVGWATYRYQLGMDNHGATSGRHLTMLGAKDMNSFDLDRVYLTGDYAFDDRYSWQTTIEMSNIAGTSKIFVKRAFLKIKSPFAIANTFVQMGQLPHPVTPLIEKVWGYRSVAKIGTERYLGVSTTWNGLGVGCASPGGMVDAELAIANENPYNTVSATKYKTLQARVTITPAAADEALKGLKITLWGQGNSNAPPSGYPMKASDNMNTWFGIFPSYQSGKLTVAGEFDMKKDKGPVGVPDDFVVKTKTSQLVSGLAAFNVSPRIGAFARLEWYDPNTDKSATADALTTLNAGLSHTMIKGVRGIVDVEYTKFQEPKNPPETWQKLDADVTLSARLEVTL